VCVCVCVCVCVGAWVRACVRACVHVTSGDSANKHHSLPFRSFKQNPLCGMASFSHLTRPLSIDCDARAGCMVSAMWNRPTKRKHDIETVMHTRTADSRRTRRHMPTVPASAATRAAPHLVPEDELDNIRLHVERPLGLVRRHVFRCLLVVHQLACVCVCVCVCVCARVCVCACARVIKRATHATSTRSSSNISTSCFEIDRADERAWWWE
jgi:hypothetical protein